MIYECDQCLWHGTPEQWAANDMCCVNCYSKQYTQLEEEVVTKDE